MTDGRYIWNFAYDANGMRISRNAGLTTYTYVYDGTQLTSMTDGLDQLHFTYDAIGRPLTMEYHPVEHSGGSCGAYCGIYYYVTNLQGDVIAILDSAGNLEAEYTYDAWGNLIDNPDDTFGFIGHVNPLRYRGYLYDRQTGLYYLQSRYYNPEIGRFISADNYPSTGQGLTGNHMFAYCGNNPVSREDESGEFWLTAVIISAVVAGAISAAADAAIQVATTGEIDPGQVLIAGVSGAISGACALIPGGAFATTAISIGVNAALNAGSYAVNQLRKGEAIDKTDLLVNVGIGAISGAAGNLFRFGSTGAIRNAGEKLVNKGMQKITNGVMNSATSTIKRGFQYIDRGISMIYQYAARAGVNSGFGSTTGCVIHGIYSLVG